MITPIRKELVPTTGYALALTAVGLLGALWSAQPAQAQERGEVTVDVERCLDIQSAEERQACFAAQVDQVLQERSQASARAEAPDEERERDVERERDARRQAEREREVERDRQAERESRSRDSAASASREDEADDQEYFGKVVEIREYKPSAYVITLDNGQVWQQTEPKRYPLRPGLEVRIYSTQWGKSYRMAGVDSGGHIQVRRLR